MLTDAEIRRLREIADRPPRYARQQQAIAAGSHVLSVVAVGTLLGPYPSWVPLACLLIVAVASAYQLMRL